MKAEHLAALAAVAMEEEAREAEAAVAACEEVRAATATACLEVDGGAGLAMEEGGRGTVVVGERGRG